MTSLWTNQGAVMSIYPMTSVQSVWMSRHLYITWLWTNHSAVMLIHHMTTLVQSVRMSCHLYITWLWTNHSAVTSYYCYYCVTRVNKGCLSKSSAGGRSSGLYSRQRRSTSLTAGFKWSGISGGVVAQAIWIKIQQQMRLLTVLC
jgi:hypothetical protein